MQVFISYAQADSDLANKLRDAIKAAGFDVWDPSQVLPGDNWGAELAQALETSKAMVVLMTPNSAHALNVTQELSYALGNLNYKGRVISVIPTSSDQSPRYSIPGIVKHLQTIELDLSGEKEQGFQQITQALRNAA